MARASLLAAALAITVVAGVGPAEAKKASPKMTCEEFLALGEDYQRRAVAYLDGYSAGGKLKEEDVAEVDVDRQMAALVVVCKEEPKKTLWDKVRSHLPGGKKVKPTKMTCEEYVALDQKVQPELVYWAQGYDKAKKVKEGDLGEVELERDVAVVYVECKQAPKESLWSKLKKHL